MTRVSRFILMILMLPLLLSVSCDAQPNFQYDIGNYDANGQIVPIPTAVQYIYFLEKDVMNADYLLYDGMDYQQPSVAGLQVGISTLPYMTVTLPNDGEEYAIGIVAVNAQGFYSGMGVGYDNVGQVPYKPGGVHLKRRN